MSTLVTGQTIFLLANSSSLLNAGSTSRKTIQADTTLSRLFKSHGGKHFSLHGISCCAAFESPVMAINAAVEGQRAFQRQGSSDLTMAIHSGHAIVSGRSYFGAALEHAIHLLNVANPGQILISQEVSEQCEGQLPQSIAIECIGQYRLRDLSQPERLSLLSAVEIPLVRTPLQTLTDFPNNLPIQSRPIIGRAHERAEIASLLQAAAVRVVTLLGPSGMGKTRLSLQIAADIIDYFPDGAFFIGLSPISDPALVAFEIARVLGVSEGNNRTILEALQEHLSKKQLLLVLDNFEQVIDAASHVARLLEAAPKLKVLVTSHIALQIGDEHLYHLQPLAPPATDAPAALKAPLQISAVALFVERAQAACPELGLTPKNIAAIVHICALLRGLPLAIELVAACSDLLPISALQRQMQLRLDGISDDLSDREAQICILRSTLDWTYMLLDKAEQSLFFRLGVFVGGCTIESAEQVCAGMGNLAIDVLDAIGLLIRRNLLMEEDLGDGELRYLMLDCIHEYANHQLGQSGEAEKIRERHAHYFLELAERAEPQLISSQHEAWMGLLEQEHDNLRAALGWAIEHRQAPLALRICSAIWRFWHVHNHLSEGRRWIEAALAISTSLRTLARVRALCGAGWIANVQGDIAQAKLFFEEGLLLARELQDVREIGMALSGVGRMAHLQGNYSQAADRYAEALATFQALDDTREIAWTLIRMGLIALEQGAPDKARPLFEESLRCFEQVGFRWGMAWATLYLGDVMRAQGLYDQATTVYEGCLEQFRVLDDHSSIAAILLNLGRTASAQGNVGQAEVYYRKSLAAYYEIGERRPIPDCLEELAIVYGLQRQPQRAAYLLGATTALRQALGVLSVAQRPEHAQVIHMVQSTLGEAGWSSVWEAGYRSDLEQAIAYVQSL